MLFRYHRGGYAESMATVVEVNNEEGIMRLLDKKFPLVVIRCTEIKIEPYSGVDSRNNWDTHIVMARWEGDKEFSPVGFTNGKF